MNTHFFRIFLGTGFLILTAACSSENKTRANLSVSQASHTGLASLNALQAESVNFLENFSASAGIHSGWAHLDGIRLYLVFVGIDGNGKSAPLFEDLAGYPIELKDESTRLSLPSDKEIPAGTFTRFQFEVKSAYDVKAWFFADEKTCYTRSADIHCVDGEVDPHEFSDYQYYHYDFLYVTTARSEHDHGNRGHFEGRIPGGFTIEEDRAEPLNLQIVVDTFRVLTFWDGVNDRPHIAPFSWTNNYGVSMNRFFPQDEVNFGLSYIPLFLAIDDPGIPQTEVYVSGYDEEKIRDLDDHGYDFEGIQYMTSLFRSTGEYLESRVIGGGPLWQVVGDFHETQNGLFSFSNGEYNHSVNGNWRDRYVHGFQRRALGETFSAALANGPDCGNGVLDPHHPEWGPRTRDCLDTDESIFFKRVR